jgi:hypothetical protein
MITTTNPNGKWESIQFTCEKTGIVIRKTYIIVRGKKTDNDYINYDLIDGDVSEEITKEVFNIVKKMLV